MWTLPLVLLLSEYLFVLDADFFLGHFLFGVHFFIVQFLFYLILKVDMTMESLSPWGLTNDLAVVHPDQDFFGAIGRS
ncbi:hypothetical protein GTO91_00415 [Heliobacterium undosum]|uniref:Uncharacterized protein n=1 Tax=Heliomicrobium undosum TaxID=121734 RepID=A0A845KXC7_9FIRM|nr:hypothetical protein [Heliomicrobium undosum]MZP28187.1 hypothetical protein [Heliomicrobium undosum]